MTASTEQAPSIAYVVSQYPKLSESFVLREVRSLKARGFRINVASINGLERPLEEMTAEEQEETVDTYYVKPDGVKGALKAHAKSLVSRPGAYFSALKMVFSLGRFDLQKLLFNFLYFTEALMIGQWMEEKDLKHLHAHLASQAATVAMFVKKVFGTGYSLTVHGPDEFYNAPGQYLEQKINATDFIVCISFFARSQMMKLSQYRNWHKFDIARLGVDPDIFAPRPQPEGRDTFEIICVGRLCEAKGQHILLDAVEKLHKDGKNVFLRLVGGGPDHDSLSQVIRARQLEGVIHLEGPVNQDRIRELYAQADAFSIPSFAEGIPVVLMESMAMEIPCVTTRITGIPELIEDGVDGLLVAPSDVDGLAQAIERLMDDRELCVTLGKNGRKKVTEKYNLPKNVDYLGEVFSRRLSS